MALHYYIDIDADKVVTWVGSSVDPLDYGISVTEEQFLQLQGNEFRATFIHDVVTILPPPPAPVPESVTPLQMRKALRASGLKDEIDAYVATMDDETQEAWEYATTIDRDNAFVLAAVTALGKTASEVDDLFRLAATL